MWIDLGLEDLVILTLWKVLTYHVTSNEHIANNSPDTHQAMLKCQLLTEAMGVNRTFIENTLDNISGNAARQPCFPW